MAHDGAPAHALPEAELQNWADLKPIQSIRRQHGAALRSERGWQLLGSISFESAVQQTLQEICRHDLYLDDSILLKLLAEANGPAAQQGRACFDRSLAETIDSSHSGTRQSSHHLSDGSSRI
jgi:hypothetical protein